MQNQTLTELRRLEKQLYAYGYAQALMSCDEATAAPPCSEAGRAEAAEVLSRAAFDLLVNDDTAALLRRAAAEAGDDARMAAEARERVEKDGFTILKIKAGINPAQDIQALTLIRQAVGPNIRLRVDANQGYTVSDAVRTLKAFEQMGVEAVEQCLPSWDLDGMRFVRSKVDLKVMLDESVHSPIDAAKACKIDAADIINIKLMKCGGLYPAEKINAIAEANHVQCMVGCMLETKVAIAAGVSLVAAKQNITEADCDSFMYAVDPEMGMPGGFAVNGGVYTLSDKPGLGIDIDF